ncbi:hypothetical protein [Aequorivita soesokkakensis]|uniref:hypothetical protein n=1 Tax=Aequorivita soesokkakensis TaxID=1385699 RepID=UPI00104243B7|nr:hypothetical protein [Aequorivita soesokkakensis]
MIGMESAYSRHVLLVFFAKRLYIYLETNSLAKGWNSNFIPGSATYVFMGNGDKVSATLTKMVHFNANEVVYIFTDTPQDSNVRTIADGTYLNIELVKAD